MPQRKYSNTVDLHKGIEAQCRLALQDTLDELKEELHNIILKDIYMVKKGTFYERTRILLINDIVETRIWNAFGKGLGGTLRFDEELFERSINIDKFQHGSPSPNWGELDLSSYLEIVNQKNDWNNPYHFPSVNRKPFWDDFLDYIDKKGGFINIYKEHFNNYVYTTNVMGRTHYTPKTN